MTLPKRTEKWSLCKEKNLQDLPYWKWANRYVKNPKKFLRYCRQIHLTKKRNGPVYKFGFKVHQDIREALTLDKENKNELWREAIKKELTKITEFQVFKTTPDGKPPPGHQKIPCHIIFDVKFDERRKARLVAAGYRTVDPGEDAYSGVVAPQAIRLGMFAAIHNTLKVIAADIGNAYLHAKTNEKLYTILGDDYGELSGKVACMD